MNDFAGSVFPRIVSPRHAGGDAVLLEQIGVITAGLLGAAVGNGGPGQAPPRAATTPSVMRSMSERPPSFGPAPD